MPAPTKEQLVDYHGLDEAYVVRHFSGKTVDDAYQMFAESAHLYCEDITYMSVVALQYYLPAVFAYLQNADAKNDFECASGVMTSLSCVCNRPDLTQEVIRLIHDITEYVAGHLAKFDANDDWGLSRIKVVRKHLHGSGRS